MAFFVAFFVLQKVVFMLYYNSLMHDATLADHFSVIWHGLPMDFSVAGYLTVIPALMILAGIWVRHRWLDTALKAYFAVTAILLASIALLDLELYGYWGFRLDMTPLFYFSTSRRQRLQAPRRIRFSSVSLLWQPLPMASILRFHEPCAESIPSHTGA